MYTKLFMAYITAEWNIYTINLMNTYSTSANDSSKFIYIRLHLSFVSLYVKMVKIKWFFSLFFSSLCRHRQRRRIYTFHHHIHIYGTLAAFTTLLKYSFWSEKNNKRSLTERQEWAKKKQNRVRQTFWHG